MSASYLEVMLKDLPLRGCVQSLITKNGIGVQSVYAILHDLDCLYIAHVAGPAVSAEMLTAVSKSLWKCESQGEDIETRFRWVQCEGGPSPQVLGSLLRHGKSVWPT